MCLDIISILTEPKKVYLKEKKAHVRNAFNRLCILALIYATLGTLIEGFFQGFSPLLVPSFVFLYLFIVIGAYLSGVWLHFWAMIFGTKKKLVDTIKVTSVGATPYALIGWVPLVGPVSLLWSLYIEYIGLQVVHGMDSTRAILTLLAKSISMIVLAVIVAGVFFTILYFAGALPPMMY